MRAGQSQQCHFRLSCADPGPYSCSQDQWKGFCPTPWWRVADRSRTLHFLRTFSFLLTTHWTHKTRNHHFVHSSESFLIAGAQTVLTPPFHAGIQLWATGHQSNRPFTLEQPLLPGQKPEAKSRQNPLHSLQALGLLGENYTFGIKFLLEFIIAL